MTLTLQEAIHLGSTTIPTSWLQRGLQLECAQNTQCKSTCWELSWSGERPKIRISWKCWGPRHLLWIWDNPPRFFCLQNRTKIHQTVQIFCSVCWRSKFHQNVDFEQISVIKSILDGADIPFYENLVYKWQYFRIGSLQAAAGSHSFAKFEEFKLEI